MRESNGRSSPAAAAWRAGKLALLGYLLVGASVATVLIGARTANRPHEVRGEWLFSLLLFAHAAVGILILVSLLATWRFRREPGLRPVHALPVLFAASYAGLLLYLFVRQAMVWVR